MQYEKDIHILRFSLDRNFACADTANPDSGERGSARRTESGILLGPCDKTHETGPGFKRKNRARSRSSALAFLERKSCCEAVCWKAANGRALLLSSQGTEAGRGAVASRFFAGSFYVNQILEYWTQQVRFWMQKFSVVHGGVKYKGS